MDWKTEQEWVIMQYFRETYPGFPKGKLVKGESPDFRLWISAKRFIGIELTQVQHDRHANSGQNVLHAESAADELSQSIRAKEDKAAFYRTDHPVQLWLLIFADYSEQDAIKNVLTHMKHMEMRNSYDRIFFFDLDTHTSLEIN
jgi:hypothetical protein